ncbi:hypothetical protein ACFFGT_24435 [Mucilaginibacter angelicae]|uniref:Uncharacterized protein n=1 Tax=Mucilaginibacter angelicae TaxID=869718 RepID=A0ABV6LD62_9SPHI
MKRKFEKFFNSFNFGSELWRCLRPALSAHTPAGITLMAGIRYYR